MNAAVTSFAEVAGKVATLAYTIAAARTLGPEKFGIFAYALSFSLLVATLPNWGFDLIVVQRGSADPRRLSTYVSEALVWRTAIAIPVFLAAGVAGVAIKPGAESATTLLLVLAASAFDVYSDAWRAAATAKQDQVGISKALIVQRLTAAGLAIAALATGLGLVGLAGAYLTASVIGYAGALLAVRRLGVRLRLDSVRREGLARMGKLSIAVGIDTIVALALFRIDQVMLEAYKGDRAVGVYAAAYRLIETVIFIAWSVAKAAFPIMSANASAEPWRLRVGVEKAMAAISLLYIPFAVGLFIEAGAILEVLYGGAYAAPAEPIVRWLALSPLLFAIGYVGSYALLALDRRWLVAGASIVAAAYNIVLNLVLIPSMSGTGAAIATTTSYALEGIITLIVLRRLIGWPRIERGFLLPVAASAIMAAAILAVDVHVIGEIAIGVVVYGIAWLGLARWLARDQLAVAASVLPGRGRR